MDFSEAHNHFSGMQGPSTSEKSGKKLFFFFESRFLTLIMKTKQKSSDELEWLLMVHETPSNNFSSMSTKGALEAFLQILTN